MAVHSLQTEDTDWYVHGRERIARFQTRESDAGIPAEAGENDGSWNFPESFHFPNDYTPHIFPLYYIYDHLGNTRVTYRNLFQCGNQDIDGAGSEPTHYLLKHLHDYFPYGKTLREWYASNEDTERFQTTHHQRDVETTLDYRGARFYDADVGTFLSLDPLAKKYSNWSPYNYVLSNPVFYMDPDGKEIRVFYGSGSNEYLIYQNGGYVTPEGSTYTYESGSNQFLDDVLASLNYLENSKTAKGIIGDLANATDFIVNLLASSGGSFYRYNIWDKGDRGSYIDYNAYRGVEDTYDFLTSAKINPAIALIHELDHAHGNLKLYAKSKRSGSIDDARTVWENNPDRNKYPLGSNDRLQWETPEEKRVITGTETKVVQELRTKGFTNGLGTRTSHTGLEIETSGPLTIQKK